MEGNGEFLLSLIKSNASSTIESDLLDAMWYVYMDLIKTWHKGGVRCLRLMNLFPPLSAHCDDTLCSVHLERVRRKTVVLLRHRREPTEEEERQTSTNLMAINNQFDGCGSACLKENVVPIAAICKDEEGAPNWERLKRQLVAWLPSGS